MTRVRFFTKEDCGLCRAAWFVLQRVRATVPFDVEVVDITAPGNESWREAYATHIPVVHVNGVEAFRHRVDEQRLRERLMLSP